MFALQLKLINTILPYLVVQFRKSLPLVMEYETPVMPFGDTEYYVYTILNFTQFQVSKCYN